MEKKKGISESPARIVNRLSPALVTPNSDSRAKKVIIDDNVYDVLMDILKSPDISWRSPQHDFIKAAVLREARDSITIVKNRGYY